MTAPELASVHGGATVTASGQILVEPARSSKWTFGILGAAAMIGVTAAIVIQSAPSGVSEAAPPRAPVAAPVAHAQVIPPQQPQVVTVPVPVTVSPPAAEPAPAPAVEQAAVEPPKPAVVVKKARPAPVAKKAAGPEATLRVVTDDGTWAKVTIGSDAQEAPGAKFHLAAGSYTVRLRNTDLGVAFSCPVSLEPGKVQTLRVVVEDKQCYGD